jgi:xanthine dehydrogenase YagS FAD-binding subunit
LRIGALARMSEVAADIEVRQRFPVIAESLLFAASGQLRNMASIGGNLMQRTRCAYFRDDDAPPCNKRSPGSGCSARHSLNRNHAIFGWSDACVATNPSDVAVAFVALDAIVHVRGLAGERSISFVDFHRLPDSTPERDTVLGRGDVIVAVEVPARVEGCASHYLKVRDRESYEFALVSVAAAVAVDGNTSVRRDSPWAGSRISPGVWPLPNRRCGAYRWTRPMRSARRSLNPSPMPAPSRITGSRSS